MLFKDISYLELWWPLCPAEWNHLCKFGRGHHEEHFCEIILNSDHGSGGNVIQKYFLSRALVAPLSSEAEPFVQIWQRASCETFL